MKEPGFARHSPLHFCGRKASLSSKLQSLSLSLVVVFLNEFLKEFKTWKVLQEPKLSAWCFSILKDSQWRFPWATKPLSFWTTSNDLLNRSLLPSRRLKVSDRPFPSTGALVLWCSDCWPNRWSPTVLKRLVDSNVRYLHGIVGLREDSTAATAASSSVQTNPI